MSIQKNSNAGQKIPCQRCAKPCKVADTRKVDAKMAVEANGDGVCAECIVTGMLKGVTGHDGRDKGKSDMFPTFTADAIRLPHIQQCVIAVVKSSGSRLPVEQLDFDEIIANWDLPLPKCAAGGLFW